MGNLRLHVPMPATWFLGRASWRRRWLGLIGLGLLAGIVGGVATAAVGGIRRSSTALDRLIEATGLPPLQLSSATMTELPSKYLDALRSLPEVERVARASLFVGREEADENWWSVRAFAEEQGTPTMVSGRRFATASAEEVIVSVNTARLFDLSIGDPVVIDFYTRTQLEDISRDTWAEPEGPEPRLRIVGIYRDPLDAARSGTGTSIMAGPAFFAAYGGDAGVQSYLVEPVGGTAGAASAIERLNAAFDWPVGSSPPRSEEWLEVSRDAEEQSQAVIAMGLGAFAAVALAAGVVAHGQSLRRWLYRLEGDQAALSAMGATRADRRLILSIALAPHVLIAVPIATALAYVLSPLFPFGVLRDIEPQPGRLADGALLVAGGMLVALVSSALTVAAASSVVAGGRSRRPARGAVGVVAAAERAGAPVALTVGSRFALRPGSARLALPVTTALAASVLAVAGVVAASVFTSSLDRLADEPGRYGNGWDLSLELVATPAGDRALAKLVDDPDIESVDRLTEFNEGTTVDGVPAGATIVETVKGSLQLQLSSGRAPAGPQEIVLGPKLLADLDKEIGDSVEVVGPPGTPVDFVVVGTALSTAAESPAFNAEAYFDDDVVDEVKPSDMVGSTFLMAQVRFAEGVDEVVAAREIDELYPYSLMNESYPRPPPEVANLAQLAMLPRALAAFLALVGMAALVHALRVGVRSRRHDLGILLALGFTRLQAGLTIVAMTTTIVGIGVVIGLPLGLVVGASGWRLVAERVFVAPDNLAPVVIIVAIAAVAVVVANLTALLPARSAARLAPIEALRAE